MPGAKGIIMPLKLLCLLLSLLALSPSVGAQPRQPELMEGKKTLFKRVILRPNAMLVATPGAATGTPMPAFSVLYVYGSSGEFVEVGRAIGKADGYVQQDKVIEWKQTIVATFTNPADRQRSLMFRTREAIEDIVRGPDAIARLGELRAAAIAGRGSDGGQVVAIEPETPPDIRRNFYFFPILSEKRSQLTFNHVGRILEVASLTLPAAPTPVDEPVRPRDSKVGIVFVVDTSKSMAPYIERVRQAIVKLQQRLEATPAAQNLRFGLVGFRQSLGNNDPRVEYHVKTFLRLTKDSSSHAFLNAIQNVKEAPVETRGFDEDSLGGIFEAIRGSDWRELQARFVILITDAGPLRDSGPEKTDERFMFAPGLGAAQMNQKAVEEKISIFALHLRTPEGRNDHPYAAAQYGELARFPGGASGYYAVPNGDLSTFSDQLDAFAGEISRQIVALQSGQAPRPPAPPRPGNRVEDAVARNFYAMQLAYLGTRQGTQAPEMFRAYVSDIDLASATTKSAIGVRIFLTKNQLSTMYGAAKAIIEAAEQQIMDSNKFFGQVRQAMAIMARDPTRRIDPRVDTLGSALGEFLEGLPYVQASPFLSLTEQKWRDMGAAEQTLMLADLARKRRFMEDWHDTPANWVALAPNVPDGEMVTAYPLEQLP